MKHFDSLYKTIMEDIKSSKRHLIKESMDWDEWYEHCEYQADKIVNRIADEHPEEFRSEVLNSVESQFTGSDAKYITDKEAVAAMLLDGYIFVVLNSKILSSYLKEVPGHRPERFWLENFCNQAEGIERNWYGWCEGNRYYYESLPPEFKSIVDEIVSKHQTPAPVAESKKVNKRKYIINR